MPEPRGMLKPQWGLYKNGHLVLVHQDKELLESNLNKFISQEGTEESKFDIKPDTML